MPTRVTSSRFVGRTAELAELDELLEKANGCCAWLTFVTGESGMGKTRLVDEFARRARDGGARILSGECVELGESELPYAPIVSALRPLARRSDPALEALGPARAELAGLLPELRGDGVRPAPASSTPQARLFELLLAILDHLGREQPVVLVIEDLHWADRSTRDFLVFLSRALCRERVLVVATYRSDELHRRHPLRPVVAELERSDRAVRIPLRPFTRVELVAQLEDILGGAPPEGLVDRLLARSEGNPLFAEELLAAGRDGRGEVPPTLRDALMLRVEALSEDAQELLRVVAAGQRVDHDVLRTVSGLEGRPLRDALREAVGQQLLAPDEEGRYAFRHALLREAVHDDLLPGEHAELHAALADALSARRAGTLEELTEIAHHLTSAGDRPGALGASVRAARSAECVHAHGEAAALLERVLELWDRVPDADELAGADHVELLRRTAAAHDLYGDHKRAAALLQQALGEIDREAEAQRAALLLERLGRAQWELGKGATALETYDQALALLGDEPSRERATVLAAQGRALMLAGRYDEGVARCEMAIAEARAGGHRAAEDAALNTLGVCLAGLGDLAGGEAALRRSIEFARSDGRAADLSRAYVNLSDVLFLGGRAEQARQTALEGLEQLAGEVDDCRWLHLHLAEITFHLGRWDETDAIIAAEAAAPGSGNTYVHFLLRRGELNLGRGDDVAALRDLEEARDRAQRSLEPQWHGPIASLLAQAYRRERRYDEARRAVETALERVQPGRNQDLVRLTRIAAAGVALEADRAQHARDLGRSDDAAESERRAQELLALAREVGGTPLAASLPMALGHLADAEADALRAAGAADPDRYEIAAACWADLQRPYGEALARRRQAESLAARGDRDAAAEAGAAARSLAAALGARWLVEELDLLARRARLRIAEPAQTDESADAEAGAGGDELDELGLTPREREVLGLLALGRTNREIGEALYMAEKTASVHVSRILAKLDVRSRTEAAAVAHRLGLAA